MTGRDGHVSPPAPPHAGTGPTGGFSAESGGAGGDGHVSPPGPPHAGTGLTSGFSAEFGSAGGDGHASPPAPPHAGTGPTGGFSAESGGAGGDGHVSPPAPLHAGTGPTGDFSAESGSAGSGSNVGRSMKPGKELALAGGFSADIVGSPPPPSGSLKGKEVEAEGGQKKRKKAVLDDTHVPCSKLPRLPNNLKALNGHARMRLEKVVRPLWNIVQMTLNKILASEAKGESSAVAEGGARRKEIHMRLDLNKEPPEDDENDDEDYGEDNEGA